MLSNRSLLFFLTKFTGSTRLKIDRNRYGGKIMDYLKLSKELKAIAEPNRLQILDMISTGEKCACDILDSFEFTQPTLSYHMKVLIEAGIVNSRKEGIWQYYSLVDENIGELKSLMEQILKVEI